MKKILFLLLCTVSMYGQVSTGQEQEFDYGIKNNSTQTVTTPTYLGTVGADGTYGKMNRNNVIEYLEFASAVNLPVTGEQGKLYLTKDNNKIYRWNGTFYQELASSDPTYQSVIDALTFTPENVANKSTTLTSSSTLYPNNDAVIAGLALKEDKVNKVTSISLSANDTNYPSELAVKTYADNLVVGMLNDRGVWDASGNVFPTTGGSGVGGVIRKGDMWYISVAGILGTKSVNVGDSFRALVNTPAQVAANWSILEANIGYVPANDANVVHLAGTETITGVKTFSPTISASGAIARGTYFTPKLSATANNDILVGLDINPTFTNGAFTGTTSLPVRVTSNQYIGMNVSRNSTGGSAITISNNNGGYNFGVGSINEFFIQRTGGNIVNTIFSTGNSVIQNGGTFTDDLTNRLQVTGTVSSGTTALGNTPPIANNQLTRKDYVDSRLALKANDSEVVKLTGNQTISGIKRFSENTVFGNAQIPGILPEYHLTEFNAPDNITPIAISGGTSVIEYWKETEVPSYAWAAGLRNPSVPLEPKDSFKFSVSIDAAPFADVLDISDGGNLYTKGVLSENITTLTPTISGQPSIIKYVNSLNTTQPVKLVIYFHGAGTKQLDPFTDDSKILIDALLSKGYIVAHSQAHGDNWGSQTAQNDYLALYNYISSAYNLSDVIFVGHSMGGLASLTMIAKNTIPAVTKWYGIFPVTNLYEAYYTEGFSSPIEAAYGFSGSANYAAATSGNDPNLYSGSAYVNRKYAMTASSGDVLIFKATNSDLINSKLTGSGIYSYIISATGNHGDKSHFIHKSIVSFVYDRIDTNKAIVSNGINVGIGTGLALPIKKLTVEDVDNQFALKARSTGNPTYQSWYTSASTRRGYFGYPSQGDSDLRLVNEESGGDITINTTSGSVSLNSLTGTGTRTVVADASGNLSAPTNFTHTGNANFTGTVTATSYTATSLPVFENNVAASSLAVGQFYRTSTGILMVKF